MRIDELVTATREAAPFGMSAIASRSGVSRPTLYRLLAGASPRVDDIRELALAAGFDIDASLVPLSDPLAAVGARTFLQDRSVEEWSEVSMEWRDRLERFTRGISGIDRDAAIIDEAGRASSPTHRSGAVHLRGDHRRVDRLVSAGRATHGRWALSGWAALDALGVEVDAPTILWVEDARKAAQLLGDSFRPGRVERCDLMVVPAHPAVFAGGGAIEDVELVAPLQAYIDAAGLAGDARDQALAHFKGTR
jgi:transcriptional regulator with XRE-family HTH domain